MAKFTQEINRKWCKRCGLCIHYCPKKVYDADPMGSPIMARPEGCVGCALCEMRCPDFALSIEKTGEGK